MPWLVRYAYSPYRVWDALVRRYRDPFLVRLPETPGTVATGHKDGVKAIISADASTLVPWRLPATEALLTEHSIFLHGGDAHRATRRLLAPLFQPSRHAEHCRTIGSVVSAELDAIAPGRIRIHELAQRITLRVILAVLFSLRDSSRVARFHAAAKRALDETGPTFLFLRQLRSRFGSFSRALSALEDIRALVQDEIVLRRTAPNADPHDDMLSQLLVACRPDGVALSDREIQVHLSDMIVAGHETTTVAIAWTCYELCRHPAVMARLAGNLGDHRYLEAVCNEALRLHPPLVFLTREVAKPLTVRGHVVPPGLGVSVVVPLVHADPTTFDEPHAFRPERFLDRNYGPEEFLPFGGGAKRCLGASFAMQEMMIVIAGLLRRFDMRLVRDRPVRARARTITVAPVGGVEVTLGARASSAGSSGR